VEKFIWDDKETYLIYLKTIEDDTFRL